MPLDAAGLARLTTLALAGVLLLILSLSLDETYLLCPDTREVKRCLSLFGRRSLQMICPFDAVVGTTTRSVSRSSGRDPREAYDQAILVVSAGQVLALSDFVRRDRDRADGVAASAAEVMGTRHLDGAVGGGFRVGRKRGLAVIGPGTRGSWRSEPFSWLSLLIAFHVLRHSWDQP